MASVNFYLDKERNKKILILIAFTFNNMRLRLTTGLHIPQNAWDKDEQKVKPLKTYADENKRLRDIKSFLLDKYDELFPNGLSISKDLAKEKSILIMDSYKVFTGKKKLEEVKKESLLTFFATFQERYKNKLSPAHLIHYNGLKVHLKDFQDKKGFRIDFDTIGKDFYLRFTDFLHEKGLKPNTIGSHIKRLKRLMNEAFDDKLTTNQDHLKRDFRVIREDVDAVYLTENEIKALYEMAIELPAKRKIRDIFVLMCYTGLRHSDWSKVSSDNIHDGKLYVRTQKTNEPVIIPIKPLVSEILERYGTIQIPSLQKTNDAIRWIGEKAFDQKIGPGNIKKWLEIRTHTVRRSFATNAYLAGIPMHDIMQITGHRTTGSFLRYIRVTKLETAEKLKDHPFFS
jgi:site-specific recombinase XerD